MPQEARTQIPRIARDDKASRSGWIVLATGDGFQGGQTAKARSGHRVQSLPVGTGSPAVSAEGDVSEKPAVRESGERLSVGRFAI
jgi:hypothetical protein